MEPQPTLILSSSDLRQILTLPDCIASLEEIFALGPIRTDASRVWEGGAVGSGVHIQSTHLSLQPDLLVIRLGRTATARMGDYGQWSQGELLVYDGNGSQLLAVMDANEIAILRAATVTAIGARRLARPDSAVVTLCGCGPEGQLQLAALRTVLPIARIYAYDRDPASARDFVAQTAHSELRVEIVGDLAAAVPASDVCIACMPSSRPFLDRSMVRAGTFIVAVGSGDPENHALTPGLFRGNTIVVDDPNQCAASGELRHAIDGGTANWSEVHATLSEISMGRKAGRTSAHEIVILDSAGALQHDAAIARTALQKALASSTPARITLSQ